MTLPGWCFWLALLGAPAEESLHLELPNASLSQALAALAAQEPTLQFVALEPADRRATLRLDGGPETILPLVAARFGCQATRYAGIWLVAEAPEPRETASLWLTALASQPETPAGQAIAVLGLDPASWADGVGERLQQPLLEWLKGHWETLRGVVSRPASGYAPVALDGEHLAMAQRLVAAQTLSAMVGYPFAEPALRRLARVRGERHGDRVAILIDLRQDDGTLVASPLGDVPAGVLLRTADDAHRLGWRPAQRSGARPARVLALPVTLTSSGPGAAMLEELVRQAGVAVRLEATVGDLAVSLDEQPLWTVLDAVTVAMGRPWAPQEDALEYSLWPAASAASELFAAMCLAHRVSALPSFRARRAARPAALLLLANLDHGARQAVLGGGQASVDGLLPETLAALGQAARMGGWPDEFERLAEIDRLTRRPPTCSFWFAGDAVVARLHYGGGAAWKLWIAGYPGPGRGADGSVPAATGIDLWRVGGRAMPADALEPRFLAPDPAATGRP